MELEAPSPCRPLPPPAAAWGGIQGAVSSQRFVELSALKPSKGEEITKSGGFFLSADLPDCVGAEPLEEKGDLHFPCFLCSAVG